MLIEQQSAACGTEGGGGAFSSNNNEIFRVSRLGLLLLWLGHMIRTVTEVGLFDYTHLS